jgi:hypothetical protein
MPGVADCDQDGMDEQSWGARCGAGDEGFPAWGTLRCDSDAEALACRTPAAPGTLLGETRARGAKALVADGEGIGLLRERELGWYGLAPDGSLIPQGELRLARPSDDAVLVRGRVLAADRAGLTVYDRTTGAVLASLPTCGKARRVFADGRRAYVIGLRSILVVDITNPSTPAVLRDLRFAALPDGSAWAEPSTRCGAFYAVTDLVCDATGLCPWFGRIAAAEEGNRLALSALGRTYVLDFRSGLVPVVAPGIATGPLSALRFEDKLLYAVRPCGDGMIYAEEDDEWTYAGRHDVSRWVEGTVDAGAFSAWLKASRVAVGTRQ